MQNHGPGGEISSDGDTVSPEMKESLLWIKSNRFHHPHSIFDLPQQLYLCKAQLIKKTDQIPQYLKYTQPLLPSLTHKYSCTFSPEMLSTNRSRHTVFQLIPWVVHTALPPLRVSISTLLALQITIHPSALILDIIFPTSNQLLRQLL